MDTGNSTLGRRIRLFVASPDDVKSERRQLAGVVEELNLTISALACEKNAVLELVRWETHVHPDLGPPQDVVDRQIPEYDIFIGILWKRMGTPSPRWRSGTEAEFRRAYVRWKERKTLPVLFYFCQRPFKMQSVEESDRYREVLSFRAELSSKGLIADYDDHDEFADRVRRHLLLVLGGMLSPRGSPAATAERVAERTSADESRAVRAEVARLADEFEKLLAPLMSSDVKARRKAGVVVSNLRALSLRAYPFLPELTTSPKPGERLAAIAVLQSIPTAEYLQWLAEKVETEAAYVGIHAAVALRMAVRALHGAHAPELLRVITTARNRLVERFGTIGAESTDRYRVLGWTQQELEESISQADDGE